jgi:hypothetical protein
MDEALAEPEPAVHSSAMVHAFDALWIGMHDACSLQLLMERRQQRSRRRRRRWRCRRPRRRCRPSCRRRWRSRSAPRSRRQRSQGRRPPTGPLARACRRCVLKVPWQCERTQGLTGGEC